MTGESSRSGRGMRALMVVFFLGAAAVQYNDPDPFLWMGIYLSAMGLTLALPRRPALRRPAQLAALAALVGAVLLGLVAHEAGALTAALQGRPMEETVGIEEAREAGGLLIVALWLGWMTRR